jgi:hypothetical protein
MDNHKELKRKYKEMDKPMGVMQVKNNANGKVFICAALNLEGKINSHRFQLEMGSHMNKDLQREWNQYGEKNFSFEVLEVLDPVNEPSRNYSDDLKVLEEMWLERIKPYDEKGYNKG